MDGGDSPARSPSQGLQTAEAASSVTDVCDRTRAPLPSRIWGFSSGPSATDLSSSRTVLGGHPWGTDTLWNSLVPGRTRRLAWSCCGRSRPGGPLTSSGDGLPEGFSLDYGVESFGDFLGHARCANEGTDPGKPCARETGGLHAPCSPLRGKAGEQALSV